MLTYLPTVWFIIGYLAQFVKEFSRYSYRHLTRLTDVPARPANRAVTADFYAHVAEELHKDAAAKTNDVLNRRKKKPSAASPEATDKTKKVKDEPKVSRKRKTGYYDVHCRTVVVNPIK